MQYNPAASIRAGSTWHKAAFRLGRRGIEAAICTVLLLGAPTLSAWAQDAAPATASDNNADSSAPADYTTEQLDALLAPIALYPDQLLTQILMASAYPLQIVEAYRWLQQPANSALTGNALATALEQQSWDPSVKSLVPFPQVLSTMNDKLDWVQQLGYAVENQEGDVMNSVQRLRAQAQAAGQLNSNAQQTVSTEGQSIIIVPAQPNVVYVPAYNPIVVYGVWPYPAYPPVYWPPPPGYALAAGIAFGVGIAVTASLWGWARPNWGYHGGYGNINVNVNRYNNINVNRTQIHNSNWRANRPAGAANRPTRPPGGPVGKPGRPGGGLPANAIGRDKVSVPGNITKPPGGIGGNRPGNGGANRPGNGAGNRPAGNNPAGKPGGGMNKPGGGNKPALGGGNRPQAPAGGANRPSGGSHQPGAFSGMNQGKSASQFGDRGAQSRSAGGFGGGGGGGRMGGGGGRRR
jgi:uncharacterized membrane protein YgcG